MQIPISNAKIIALKKRMHYLGIYQKDIQEKFVRSRGKGGQRLNKTSTCVYLRHIPTGIEVKCQKERLQATNRYIARKILADKVEALISKIILEQKQIKEKKKRQNRKRCRQAKEAILRFKRKRSEKKKLRAYRIKPEDLV